jgi:hypothetical protein
MVTWRSKMNFTAYFGPWLVFGGYFALAKVRPTLPEADGCFCLAALIALGGYVLFGVGCGYVEAHAWEQCNRWRQTIVRLARGSDVPDSDDSIEFRQSLVKKYLLVYLLMVVTFGAGAYVLYRLTPADDSEKPAHSRARGD